MSYRVTNKKHIMILNITVAIWATVMFILLPACSNRRDLGVAVCTQVGVPEMKLILHFGRLKYVFI